VILHSKSISIDHDIAVIGSSNMDIRSFELNLEVTLVCYSDQVVDKLRAIEAEYLRCSRPLHLEAWQSRPLHTRLFENVARLTSALQ
jgi:cardiolipin synthase